MNSTTHERLDKRIEGNVSDAYKLEYSTIIILFFFVVLSIFIIFSRKVDTDNKVRSSSLRESIVENGGVHRTDYHKEDGKLAFAADKHYASLIETHGDHYLLEEYFDEHGNSAEQSLGHYALLREYDLLDRIYRLTYLGLNGKPVLIKSGYAIIERTFNKDDRVEWEMYYDAKGSPVNTRSLGYGIHNQYNDKGRNVQVTYLDEHKNPMITRLGYAIAHRSFYEKDPWTGRIENEFYFDENDRPISLSHGEYGLHKEYDEFGRNNVLTYLDFDGQPIVTREGYTTMKRTFYSDDTVRTEMYFDLDGKPVALSQGQYGILKENGYTLFLDAEGNEQFNLRNWLYANPISVVLIALILVVISSLLSRKVNWFLLILYIVFIVYMTLMCRTDGDTRAELDLFWSYKQIFLSQFIRLEILNNIWFFIPLGIILSKLWQRRWFLLIAVLLSSIIEAVQYFTGFGLCELDDVISNSLGAFIGFCFGCTYWNRRIIDYMKACNKKEKDNLPA